MRPLRPDDDTLTLHSADKLALLHPVLTFHVKQDQRGQAQRYSREIYEVGMSFSVLQGPSGVLNGCYRGKRGVGLLRCLNRGLLGC